MITSRTSPRSTESTNEEAKKEGLILDYKILIGTAATPQDFLLMQEYKKMAALDNLRDKFDPIATKIIGNEDAQRQGSMKRMEVREIMGDKLMREITLR